VDTVHPTGLSTGTGEPNVVPRRASATLDCRLLPGTRPEAILEEVRSVFGSGEPGSVSIEVLHRVEARESPWEDPFFEALARRAAGGRSDATAGPALSTGFTDSAFAREAGARAYGFVPFEVTESELARIHGVGERVSIENLRLGLGILLGAVLDVAAR
jgi:carboxypeptidase PM20D1